MKYNWENGVLFPFFSYRGRPWSSCVRFEIVCCIASRRLGISQSERVSTNKFHGVSSVCQHTPRPNPQRERRNPSILYFFGFSLFHIPFSTRSLLARSRSLASTDIIIHQRLSASFSLSLTYIFSLPCSLSHSLSLYRCTKLTPPWLLSLKPVSTLSSKDLGSFLFHFQPLNSKDTACFLVNIHFILFFLFL